MSDASTDTATGRSEYVAFWNDVLADKFERFRNILMDGLSLHSDVPLGNLGLPPGARVLDFACGWGDTAMQLARKIGPSGSVLGIDCCGPFLDKGRRDAEAAGLTNLRFVEADAETYPFEPDYDFCFSRFGMMYVTNPVAAMRNVRSALKPGAQLMFTAWRRIEDNPGLDLPKRIMLEHLPPPDENAATCGPGPFSMADPDVFTKQLEVAGFEGIDFTRCDGPIMLGSSVAQAVDFQLAIGPAGEVFREAGDEAEQRRDEIEAALHDALAPYEHNGEIIMDSSSWTITARRPLN